MAGGIRHGNKKRGGQDAVKKTRLCALENQVRSMEAPRLIRSVACGRERARKPALRKKFVALRMPTYGPTNKHIWVRAQPGTRGTSARLECAGKVATSAFICISVRGAQPETAPIYLPALITLAREIDANSALDRSGVELAHFPSSRLNRPSFVSVAARSFCSPPRARRIVRKLRAFVARLPASIFPGH